MSELTVENLAPRFPPGAQVTISEDHPYAEVRWGVFRALVTEKKSPRFPLPYGVCIFIDGLDAGCPLGHVQEVTLRLAILKARQKAGSRLREMSEDLYIIDLA